MRLAAALAAVLVAAAAAACGGDVERSARTVCGARLSVAVDGDDVTVEAAPGSLGAAGEGGWRLAWLPSGEEDLGGAEGSLPLTAGDAVGRQVRVTTPDRRCTGLVGVEPGEVRVLGDSLAFHVFRAGLAPWEGTPGAAWAVVSDDPASSAADEVRGAMGDAPRVLVLVFGANDALWMAGSGDAGERLAVVRRAVAEVLGLAAPVPCLRVVTPSAGDTVIFGLGERYRLAAEDVGDAVRELAPAGSVVDWQAASAAHHRPDGTDGDWFPDGDEIHPNDEGRRALVALVEAAVATC